MENETIEVNLSDVCRACLSKTEEMINLLPKNAENSGVIQKFSSFVNFQVEFNDILPAYLCKSCEEKLEICHDFLKLAQKSNEIIKECLKTVEPVEVDLKELILIDTQNDNDNLLVKSKRRRLRLTQFSSDLVAQAIERSKSDFFQNCKCNRCGFISCNTRALSVHMTHLHKESKSRWCSICNFEFDDLTAHQTVEHFNKNLRCEFCEKVFNSKGHFVEHLRSHSENRPFKCLTCGKGFISSRHLKVHFRIHSNEKPYACLHCSKKFRQNSSLKNHLKLHDSDNGDLSEIKDDLKSNGTPTTLNFCKDCNRKVRSIATHNAKHHAIKNGDEIADRALCTVCGRVFKSNSKLKLHMRIHTGEVPYKCSYCEKRVSSRNQLVVHERTHTGEKPHICKVCGKGFAQSSVLNTHMRIHTGRPEVCNICKKRFCRPAELKLHMRKHTGEKPYQCVVCANGFKQRSHLVEHLKTHSDDRPYKCTHCDRGFKQSGSLKSHIKIHLGSKPFKCSQCSYACRQSYSLTQHMRQHEVDAPKPEKPHVCVICQKNFSTMAMLMSHTNVAHAQV